MTFWDTFWATMWGALAGAVVGGFVAWLFSLDLKRREEGEVARSRLDAAVSDVVRLLGEVGGAGQAFMFALQLRSAAISASPPHLARQQLLSATLTACMAAGEEEGPLRAVYGLVTREDSGSGDRTAADYEHAAHALVQWRQGKLSTQEAATTIEAGSAPVAP